MKEQDVKDLGFEFVERYAHDQYYTNQYAKGILTVEFTYEGDKLVNYDMTIHEVFCEKITLEEIKILTPILGKI